MTRTIRADLDEAQRSGQSAIAEIRMMRIADKRGNAWLARNHEHAAIRAAVRAATMALYLHNPEFWADYLESPPPSTGGHRS